LLSAIPRLSNLSVDIPLAANSFAIILKALVFKPIAELQSRSVGPEPAMMRIIGLGSGVSGIDNVP
jgi:hypothetical protein